MLSPLPMNAGAVPFDTCSSAIAVISVQSLLDRRILESGSGDQFAFCPFFPPFFASSDLPASAGEIHDTPQ